MYSIHDVARNYENNIDHKNHIIHELLFDINFSGLNIPDKLYFSIENIQRSNGTKRELLIQQSIGYIVAMKDFNLINSIIADNMIDKLHDAK